LGDETRMRIVALLSHGELCVCHLESALDLNQSTASRHLGILKAAGVVDSRRDGTWVYYRLIDQEHETVSRTLDVLIAAFGAERTLKSDHARLRKSCGPNQCK
jgi:ArsR family transcriptional regulator, arsenate/arsenite/antimonite-responsive transcriptional repressor